MKKLMAAALAASAICAFAEEELEEEDGSPLIWGFGNTGIYSGYQLYGSLLNKEPTWQTYAEINVNLPFELYAGVGLWFNSDLTSRRHDSYEKFCNEFDPNVHFGRTFWFDDDRTWGLDWRSSFVWYYYPHHAHRYAKTDTTMDFNHSFALLNPFVIPFVDVVREYHENDANLLQFGLKKPLEITDELTLTASVTAVWRENRYNWCFPTAGFTEFHNSGIATVKAGVDANYALGYNFGLFAKLYFSSVVDPDLRDAADNGGKRDYGRYKDFAWGGAGVYFNF
ncbi:MAG: hypothetical protein ILO34_00860 [Kiritimatiellae bacterium]|nr:hypothetical protein [Kiritimatiellia bacterium]